MDRLVIDMDSVSGDYIVDPSNGGEGLNIDHMVFSFIIILRELQENFGMSAIELIDLICQVNKFESEESLSTEMLN